jgi:hypothetical protein
MAKKQVAVSLRKPPSPEKADAFVSGGDARRDSPPAEAKRAPKVEAAPSSAARAPEVEATPAPASGPVLVGVDGRARRALTVYLPNPLAERLLLHCIEQDRDMSNVIGEALEDHLHRRLGAGPFSAVDGGAPPQGRREGAPPCGSFHDDPFRSVDFGDFQGRVDRILQVGRALLALWRQRAWA